MTKISTLLFITALSIATPGFAQKSPAKLKSGVSTEQVSQFNYTFSQLTAPYAALVNPTSLNNGAIWDDPTFLIPSPFPVTINGATVNTISISGLGATIVGELTADPNSAHLISGFEADIIDRGYDINTSLSPISYLVDGNTGSRILKIEWKEVGSYAEYDSSGGTLTNFISFQTWIYEGTNVIEYRYGPNTITNPMLYYEGDTGPFVGVGFSTAAGLDVNLLTGPAASPTLVLTQQAIIGTPASGTVYRFTPATGTGSSVAEQQLSGLLKAFPNPATDLLQLELQNRQSSALVQLYDLSGREVKRVQLTEMQTTLDISDLAAGMYSLRMQGAAGSLKVIKK